MWNRPRREGRENVSGCESSRWKSSSAPFYAMLTDSASEAFLKWNIYDDHIAMGNIVADVVNLHHEINNPFPLYRPHVLIPTSSCPLSVLS